MSALRRFYSVDGRCSIAQFAVVAVIVAAVLFVISRVDWQWGLATNILAGAAGGAAFAKLLSDAIRRLRDAGISRHIAAWLALAVGVAAGSAVYAGLDGDPPWAQAVLDVVQYGAPIVCAVALLWPSRGPVSDDEHGNDRAGVAIATLCVIGGAVLMGFIAWLSIGMDANGHRDAAFAAAHERSATSQ